jgi:predicted ATPase
MNNQWDVTYKKVSDRYLLFSLVTGGIGLATEPSYEYTLQHKETGERIKVIAHNNEELGQKIAEGNFSK